MSLVSRNQPTLFGGVSQQPPTLRRGDQHEAQVNAWPTVAEGLKKRPGWQHVARISTSDLSAAYVHTINRDVTERYAVVVTDGDLQVFDAVTGAEINVTFPTGTNYLNVTGSASEQFSLVSIADYTFVVNKEQVVATKTSPTTTPVDFSAWFRPSIWGSPEVGQFFNAPGAGTLTGTVDTFSDLPKAGDTNPPSNGDLYKVVGLDTANFGGYYVRRVGGVWEETYGPGANTSLDELTLPHALVREADGTFSFRPFTWSARKFGDDETNPAPTFVGRPINDVFYWKNRLGFLTDENVVLSGAGDYGNFWRNTVTALLDADVVDVAVSTTKVSLLQYAVPFNNSLMLFADQTQFSLNVTDLVTPTSVSIDEATSFEVNQRVRPISVGSQVYFASNSGPFSRVREYFVQEDSVSPDAADITAHVPRYVPNGLFNLVGNTNEDALFAISSKPGERNRVYTYKFYWQGDEKIQSAWSYWDLDVNATFLSINVIESELYAIIQRSDGAYLERCDLDSGAVADGVDFDILLDRRYDVQAGDMSYNPGDDETTITLPYSNVGYTNANLKVILKSGSGNVGRLVDQIGYTFPTANTITVPGDVTGFDPVVGINYEMTVRLSEQFIKDRNRQSVTTGRLQMRAYTLYYQDAAFFQTRVYPYGPDYGSTTEDVVPPGLDAFTGRTLGSEQLTLGEADFDTGAFTFYVNGNSRDVVVELLNPSHLQAKFSSAEWEAMYFNRTRNR